MKFLSWLFGRLLGKFVRFLILLFLLCTLLLTAPLRWINPPVTSFLLRAEIAASKEQNLAKTWVPYAQLPDHIKLAVLGGEDQRFPRHFGFDIKEIQNAIADYRAGMPLRGASTITQQLIKNLYLSPTQSYKRKVIEAWLALSLELTVPKKRIFELYLNTSQFSDAYFGIEPSSQYLFGKSARDLNKEEAAHLAACLPAPSLCRPGNSAESHMRRKAHILKQMGYLKNEYLEFIH